ncbi:aldo/keto reductase [Corynebacterium sp. 153RC1]|uniref:aldo/keto reductase n=1 Tax=unclassified Corynebacterium TaxID=2624378 RepID=UPI00211CC1C9|nr:MULTISPECIES: aldo/keto reductase [unclassified Corynebacterium]MCQ9371149.1 aldo/keto reductase [Corynebacterium sp. 35RC1]MCQ9352550.1 aldo/keto reductase [Corynebacterium sp. 209RC1]MCQ9354734.1 aldo/keto reductase [Corynebacterium sp. 1222RC1]MCQ9356845.1 aldo/keto reductase [Corynebacterium sp. 122RC1]MCQ9358951.1 aldo/keto reductase [Corynebacterium sp. 142RC1]
MNKNVIAGMMRIAELSDAQIRALYTAYREEGVTHFDHADIYGAFSPGGSYHYCERRFAQALTLSPAEREEITLQTKVGIVAVPNTTTYYDHSYAHIMNSVEESLRALDVDYIDTLLLHRPDTLMEPEEVARAFTELQHSGKVRTFGVSNYTTGQIEFLQQAIAQPLEVNQVQLSLVQAGLVSEGITASANYGLLEYARRKGVRLQAWAPFQAAGGTFLHSPEFPELNAVLGRVGNELGCSATAVAASWICSHPAGIQVVAGTSSPERVREIAQGAGTQLSRRQWYALYTAAGHPLP